VEKGQSTLLDFFVDTSRGLETDGVHIVHPYIKKDKVEYRKFQFDLAKLALEKNLLIVLPTGLGKTVIALLSSAEMLRTTRGKILFLAPTRPLAAQHMQSFRRSLLIADCALFTGSTPAERRKELWNSSRIIFATPQAINNDLQHGLYDMNSVSFVVFDEAHRAVGNYAYVEVAKACREAGARILALTASPGAKAERVEGILSALGIESVEIREREDEDVRNYVKEVEEEIVRVPLPYQMKEMRAKIDDLLREKIVSLQRMGFLRHKKAHFVSRKDLISIRGAVLSRKKGGYLFGAMHNSLMAMHAYHCSELLESQGIEPLRSYLARLKQGKSKAEKSFLKDSRISVVMDLLSSYRDISHPKLPKMLEIIREQLERKRNSLIIVFTQYRDTIETVLSYLRNNGISAEKFIGQADREGVRGMSQKEQSEVLRGFASMKFNVLVASSIGEEGIDIPDVDLVLFYEPVPSEIRTIQRKGRTGRSSFGRVVTLVAEGTRDEAYFAASRKRVGKMKRIVRSMKSSSKPSSQEGKQQGVQSEG